ncbi:hypothetical protein [Asticcacaulis endophyticus]|uniref:hypothetical protein n=1 Tax=Asticcacaulis endophyticus TaxID=1395890 RepID=UPI001E59615B|nr:hypothetical protein [Asticcacaulis endophyticus]
MTRLRSNCFRGLPSGGWDQGLQKQALRRLKYIDAAVTLEDLRIRLPIDWRLCKAI